MSALGVAVLYFGTFLAIGWSAKRLIDRAMREHGADLDDVQAQAGANRRPREMFLLGAWRKEPYPDGLPPHSAPVILSAANDPMAIASACRVARHEVLRCAQDDRT